MEPPIRESPAVAARVGADELVVLRVSLELSDARREALWETLHPDEQARAQRYHFPQHRARAIASRGLLRAVLGRVLGRAPRSIALTSGEHGKPALLGGEDLAFNVSHAETHALIALCRGRALGVDIEGGSRPFDVPSLAAVVFTSGERAELARFPATEQRAAFLRGWTRKEAYLKARAVGLSMPLTTFSVSLAVPAGALTSAIDPDEAARFALAVVPAPPGYEATIAWERTPVEVRTIRVGALETE